MLRLDPTALSVTMSEVDCFEACREQRQSFENSDAQSRGDQIDRERVLGRPGDLSPPGTSRVPPSVVAEAKMASGDAGPHQRLVDVWPADSPMEDAPLSAATLAEPSAVEEDFSRSSHLPPTEQAQNGIHIDEEGQIAARAITVTTPQQRRRVLARGAFTHCHTPPSGRSFDGTGTPRWLSLPPRRPHPAWAAAERAIAISPLANRASR